MDPDGTGHARDVIASHYCDLELNSPNDIVVHSDGSIYFTDPPAGRTAMHGLERPQQLNFQGVFRIPPGGGAVQLLLDDFERPNGLCFSPDESRLYVNDTARSHIRVFDIRSDGTPQNGRVFAENIGGYDRAVGLTQGGVVDGMKCDERENLWVTGPGGIWIFSPEGQHLGIVQIAEGPANLHWGGADWSWMYVAATTSIYRLRARVSGRLEPFMR
jgi:gluconolactonase